MKITSFQRNSYHTDAVLHIWKKPKFTPLYIRYIVLLYGEVGAFHVWWVFTNYPTYCTSTPGHLGWPTFFSVYGVGVTLLHFKQPLPLQMADITLYPQGLRVYCIDDSPVMRLWLGHFMGECGAVEVFGATSHECETFVDAAASNGDIVICDQNLQFEDRTLYGTDLLSELIARQFQGLLCIHSANDAPEDVQMYKACGAHIVLGKGMSPKELIQSVKQGYLTHISRPQSPTDCSIVVRDFETDASCV